MKWIIFTFLVVCSFILTLSINVAPLDNEDNALMEQSKPFIIAVICGLLISAVWVVGATYGVN